MEAVPKLPFINFDMKVSPEPTHFGPKLKQYISEAYREDPDSYSNEIHQLEGMRSTAVRASIDSAGVSALVRYFCQLRALQSRFPMAKGQPAACSFTWKDLYANMNCTLPDIRFEMACILYNIGAIHSQLGSAEPRTTADSLKAACVYYQTAAWVFLVLREQYPQPPGADVSTEILRMLHEICLAQAQECIMDKSIQDTRKPSVIGAVAAQVMHFYKNCLFLLGPSTGTDNIHEIIGTKLYNYYHRYLSFKVAYISCIVYLYQGIHSEEQQKMGERVAYYQMAVDRLAAARKLAKYIEPVKNTLEALIFANDVVEGKKKAAKNENEFIYHEEVPEKDMLTDLKPVCLVKTIAININDPEISGPDLFARLVPMGAHEASSMYSEEKAKLLRHIVSQAEAKNTELMEFMSSLQLDQLELLDTEQTIPQEIVDRCAAMNAKTDVIQTLVDSMNSLAEIISDVEHSLTEIKTLIQEETAKEKEYQTVVGPRPPSIVQTEISREYNKYQEAHARTTESNQVLHKAMTLHIANLRLLAQPLDVLHSKIPTINNIEGLDRDTMCEMRRVVGKAREMQAQRAALVQRLREALAADDITAQLLVRSTEPAEDLFKQEIDKHTPQVKIIEQNLAAQENIINKLTSLYAAYGDSRRMLTDVIRKREGLINALVTSYDTHTELLGKSRKGLEFYRKLAHNVAQLLARLRSTCQVQREERAQVVAGQANAPTSIPTATPSSVPASSALPKTADLPTPSSGAPTLKLKDYLPYMKNRNLARSVTPQAQIEPVTSDAYYPESIYPTSVRPTPVGSEAADLNPMNMPDGVVMPAMQSASGPYARYGSPYAPAEAMQQYAYPTATKSFDKPIPDDVQSYSYSPYTPPQYSGQMPDPQTYTNPYYTATQNNTTIVTDSQNPAMYASVSRANVNPNDPYAYSDLSYVQSQTTSQLAQVPEPAYSGISQADLSASFAQMQVSVPKTEPANYGGEYSQTYYSIPQQQYVNVPEANMAYSSAGQGSNTTLMPSQLPSDYSNYSYSNDAISQYGMQSSASNTYAVPEQQYSYTNPYDNTSQSYAQAQRESTVTSSTSLSVVSASQTYSMPNDTEANYMMASLSQFDSQDNPIKSHVTGQALSSTNMQSNYQSYNPSLNYPDQQYPGQPNLQNVQPTNPQYSGQPNAQNNQPANTQYPGQPNVQSNQTANTQYPGQQNVQNNQATNPQYPGQPNVQSNQTANTQYPDQQNVQNNQATNSQYPGHQNVQNIQPANAQYPVQPNVQSNQTANMQYPGQPNEQCNQATNAQYPGQQNVQNIQPANAQYPGHPNVQSNQPTNTQYPGQSNVQNLQPASSQYPGQSNVQSVHPGTAQYPDQSTPQNVQTPTQYLDQTQNVPQQNTQYQDQQNYAPTVQNHPGYVFNSVTGNYEYSYGSQNSFSNYGNVQQGIENQPGEDPNWAKPGVYTSAGTCETVQSPSESLDMQATGQISNNQTYYNLPYGYQTALNQANEMLPQTNPVSTNYGANINQSTYMQSGQGKDTAMTMTGNQVESFPVTTPKENTASVNETGVNNTNASQISASEESASIKQEITDEVVNKVEEKPELSAFDLLSDIDFSVEQTPLMPQIKVPQVSEKAIVKAPITPRIETPKITQKEEVIERPPKRDIFSDPALLNKFTQEVKNLQKMTDSLMNKTSAGITLLESKWKTLQDVQIKENLSRTKRAAMQHMGNVATQAVPYDDSRLTLKSDPNAYINASYYKQLGSWCIPLVISKPPEDNETVLFWKAIMENKISCIVCLLSEIEMQGKSYWPTAIGQSLKFTCGLRVALDEATCTVHWTERRLTLTSGRTVFYVTHYQINVFPAKMVCPPLVVLAARVADEGWAGRAASELSGACVQCAAGAGRSALFALLLLAVCQVRAGHCARLCDMLDTGCIDLYKHRTNVLEDPKYLLDAYKTVLFYVQGVLCSGTTLFNGEAVSVPSGAGVLPPAPASASASATASAQKNKFSRESFEEMKQSPGLKSGDMKDPLNFLDPLWSLKKK